MSSPAETVEPREDDWQVLPRLLAEASNLGAEFRIRGAEVEITHLDALPGPLAAELQRLSPLAWHFLGAGRADAEAIKFFNQLGVRLVLVEGVTTASRAMAALDRDLAEHSGVLGIDCETAPLPAYRVPSPPIHLNRDGTPSAVQPAHTDRTALDPLRSTIALLQLYAGGSTVYVFSNEAAIAAVLDSAWLRSKNLVAHHAGFEIAFLQQRSRQRSIKFPNSVSRGQIHCSAQAHGLLHGVGFGGSGRALEDAAQQVLGLTPPKASQVSDWSAPSLSRGQFCYAATDAVLVYRLWMRQHGELLKAGRWIAYELQRRAIAAVADMSLRGLLLDREEHARQVAGWETELAAARDAYTAATGSAPPTAPSEIRDWLRSSLPPDWLAAWPTTPIENALSVEAKHIKRLAQLPGTAPVLTILGTQKLLSTFGPRLVDHCHPLTGRLHPSFIISGAKTGRFSCSRPNLQQLPAARAPEFRRCIIAASGHMLIGADWNQIEFRAAAHRSRDAALTRLFAEGRDLHTEVAAMLLSIPVAEVTKEQRQAAKPVGFGSLYGMGAASLAEYAFDSYGVVMSVEEAQKALQHFFRRFPTLHRWRDVHYQTCTAQRRITNASGRVIEQAWEPGNQLRFTLACNAPIQGDCADAMLRAITLVYGGLQRRGIPGGMVATVHDELLLEIPAAAAEQAGELLCAAMVLAFEQTFPGAPTTNLVSVKSGHSWADLK